MWILLFLFGFSECAPQHSRSSMCESKEKQNCSFQMPFQNENYCFIYTTEECLRLTSPFSTSALQLFSESEAKFSARIHPYSYSEFSALSSAINITFTILNNEIDGFSILIKEDAMNLTFCRYLDFKNDVRRITVGTDLFYDCFSNLVEFNIVNVKMTFTSYPQNEKLEYFVFVPPTVTNKPPCKFSALIMIFCESLSQGNVIVKFFVPPELHNIDSFVVKLIQNSTNKTISSKVAPSASSTYFTPKEEGYYYVSIRPSDANEMLLCSPAKIAPFYVTIHHFDKVLLLSLCIVVILVLSLFFVLKCLHAFVNTELSPMRVMLIYSYDCAEHEAFISSFSAYLYNFYKINSCTLYGKVENVKTWARSKNTTRTKNPLQWLQDKYQESEAIIYILSEGLKITLDQNEKVHVKEGHPWRKQVTSIQAYIIHQICNLNISPPKKFCTIYFPYSANTEQTQQIPQCLKNIKHNFFLPEKMSRFLYFLMDYKPLIPIVDIYPKLPGTDFKSSEEGRKMMEKLEKIQEAVDSQRHLVKIPIVDYLGKDSEKEKLCAIEVTQLSISDQCKTVNNEDTHVCKESDFEGLNSEQEDSFFYEDDWKEYMKQMYKEFKNADQCDNLSSLLDEVFQ